MGAKRKLASAGRPPWIPSDKAVATFAPKGLLKKNAETIARVLATPSVSPNGIESAIRLLQFVINRNGRNLSIARRRALERAKRLLQRRRDAG
jgi:tRNA(adenine34) deaminase